MKVAGEGHIQMATFNVQIRYPRCLANLANSKTLGISIGFNEERYNGKKRPSMFPRQWTLPSLRLRALFI